MVDYVQSTFARMQLDCDYQIFVYKTFKDIPELYQMIPEDVEGILTSGSFPARVVQLSFPNTQRIIKAFNTDDAAICQLFFRLLDENRFLNFDRIYADLVEMFNIDLKTFLMHDFSTPLSITTNQIVCEEGLDELFEIEEQEYEKHLKLWKSGTVDLCVTRFSSIVEKLKEQGVPVYFPFPSMGYLREVCLSLFKEIEYRELQDNCSAIINVAVAGLYGEQAGFTLEYHLLTLQAALMEFFGASSQDYFFGRNASGIEILTNRKNIEKLTENYTVCKIQGQLSEHANFPVCVGYGIGRDLQQARVNAGKALAESGRSPVRASFIVNEYEKLVGPLQTSEPTQEDMLMTSDINMKWEIKTEAKKMVVPEYKIKEVLSMIRGTAEQQITSQELAEKLGITKRSANRILSAMEEQGVVEIAKTRPTSAKGRPERIYRIIEEIVVE